MRPGGNVFYNYILQVEPQRPFLVYRLVNEAGRIVADGEFSPFEEMQKPERYVPRKVGEEVPDTVVEGLKVLGRKLFDTVFEGPIWREFQRILDVGGVVSLRVTTSNRRLALLPWEAVHDGRRFLATTGQFLISRGVQVEGDVRLSRLEETPRVMAAALVPPEKQSAIAVERRANAIYSMLARMRDEGTIDMVAVTLESAADLAKHAQGYLPHIIVLVAISAGGGVLLSASDMLTSSKLTGSILSCTQSRCAVFSSPLGEQTTFLDTCWELVAQGLPAAICTRFCLTDEMEVRYLEAFFEALLRGARLDAAVLAGRSALVAGEHVAFASPVSFILTTEPLLPQPSEEEMAQKKEQTLKQRSASSTGLDRARLLLSLAHHYHSRQRYEEALETAKDAASAFQQENDKGGLRAARALYGDCLLKLDRPTEALEVFQQLLAEHRESVDLLQAFIFAKLGHALLMQGRTFEALNAFREAFRFNTKSKDRQLLVGIHLGLGQVYEAMGELQEAEKVLRQGVELARQLREESVRREMQIVLATVQIRLGKYSQARETLTALLKDAQSANDEECSSYCHILLGVLQDVGGETGPAAYNLYEAYKKAIEINSQILQVSALFNLAVVSRDALNYDEAVYNAYLARHVAETRGMAELLPKIEQLLGAIRDKVGDELFEVYLSAAKEKVEGS